MRVGTKPALTPSWCYSYYVQLFCIHFCIISHPICTGPHVVCFRPAPDSTEYLFTVVLYCLYVFGHLVRIQIQSEYVVSVCLKIQQTDLHPPNTTHHTLVHTYCVLVHIHHTSTHQLYAGPHPPDTTHHTLVHTYFVLVHIRNTPSAGPNLVC